jgi:hypothetical protein
MELKVGINVRVKDLKGRVCSGPILKVLETEIKVKTRCHGILTLPKENVIKIYDEK